MTKVICPDCGVEMECLAIGIIVKYDSGSKYSGDKYGCPACASKVVLTAYAALDDNSSPHESDEDVVMRADQ